MPTLTNLSGSREHRKSVPGAGSSTVKTSTNGNERPRIFRHEHSLYADDASAPKKRGRPIALFAEHLRCGTAVLSLQVLQEYFAAPARKLGLAAETAQRKVEVIQDAKG